MKPDNSPYAYGIVAWICGYVCVLCEARKYAVSLFLCAGLIALFHWGWQFFSSKCLTVGKSALQWHASGHRRDDHE